MKKPYFLTTGMLVLGLVMWGVYAVWPYLEHASAHGAPEGGIPAGAPGRAWPPASPAEPAANADSTVPQGLAGTVVPDGLLVDSTGHLVRSRRVRDVFDYFLSAANERSQAQINVMVRDHVAALLQPPARQEAIGLWERYLRYLQAVNGLNGEGVGQQNFARTKDWLAQRSAHRKQLLPEVALAWFGAEEAADQEQMERMEIAADQSLTPQQRKDRLTALAVKNPTEEKATTAGAQVTSLGKLVDDMRKQGNTPEEIGAAVAAQGDRQTGARIQAWMRDEASWEQRYAQYQQERQPIDTSPGIAEADRAKPIEQLRGRYFPVQAEAVRAFARDQTRATYGQY